MSQIRTRRLRTKNLSLRFNLLASFLLLLSILGCQNQNPAPPSQQIAKDPLPSWNDTAPKKNIIAFVDRVTKEGSPDFVPVADRIATFDNDGTLWVEYPMYTQFIFSFDRVKQMAPQHPEWKTKQPFKGILDDDMKAVMATGEKGIYQVIVATGTGMTSAEYAKIGPRLARADQEQEIQPHLHRAHLSADGRTSRLPTRQRFQNLHRLRRRCRIHASLDRKSLRHPARSGRRHHYEDTA